MNPLKDICWIYYLIPKRSFTVCKTNDLLFWSPIKRQLTLKLIWIRNISLKFFNIWKCFQNEVFLQPLKWKIGSYQRFTSLITCVIFSNTFWRRICGYRQKESQIYGRRRIEAWQFGGLSLGKIRPYKHRIVYKSEYLSEMKHILSS